MKAAAALTMEVRASHLAIRPILVAFLFVFASFPAVSWANLLSFRIGPPERELYDINPATGAGTLVTAVTPTRDIQGLAYDGNSGTLYGADHVSDSLYVINQTTGVASLVGAFGVNVASVGLAYDSNAHVLFMSHNGGSASKLFSVNTGSGVATQIGSDFGVGITGLGYDTNSDTLYGMGADFNLYTLDTTTGALSSPIGSMGFIQGGGLTFDSVAGKLYATDSSGNLWTLNTSTGVGTLVGAIGNNFHAALANTSVVPIPAAAWLFGSALGLLGSIRRRTVCPAVEQR
jgi:hypothetical protein